MHNSRSIPFPSLYSAAFALAMIVVPLAPASAQNQQADEVIAAARAQWAAQNALKPASESMANVAEDYTEFNPVQPTRVDGKAMASRFSDASNQSGEVDVLSEMLNPKVQVYGDTAILTYNYAGITRAKDGTMSPNVAKSTRVYVKQGGRWMLVHANFAPVNPPSN
jgi:ketosteroid isomerase-like protein